MATSSILSNTPLEPERSKNAWHSFLLDHRDAFVNLVRHLVVDEALVKHAISRALVRIEKMPFESSEPLLSYKQALRAVIREAVSVLKEPPDCPTVYTVATASDLSDLQLQAFPSKLKQRSYDHRFLPAQLHRDDTVSSAKETNAPKEICGICIPNTPLVLAATEFVSRFTPLWLMNHLFRTYVFAELLGRKSGLKYDPEILYLCAIMHDLGLIHEFAGSQRFELDGADTARLFLLKQGVSMARIRLVWNAIAFHTSIGIYDRMKPEIALLGFGFLADVTGGRSKNIPTRHVRRGWILGRDTDSNMRIHSGSRKLWVTSRKLRSEVSRRMYSATTVSRYPLSAKS